MIDRFRALATDAYLEIPLDCLGTERFEGYGECARNSAPGLTCPDAAGSHSSLSTQCPSHLHTPSACCCYYAILSIIINNAITRIIVVVIIATVVLVK